MRDQKSLDLVMAPQLATLVQLDSTAQDRQLLFQNYAQQVNTVQ